MSVTKQQYLDVRSSVQTLCLATDELSDLLVDIEDGSEVFPSTSIIYEQLGLIAAWTTDKINNIEKQELMNSFLVQFKGVMQEFNAKIEIVTAEGPGYGLDYGVGAEMATGFKVSVQKDGLQSSKVYDVLELNAEVI